ncbi:spore coat u precursor [hydrocarbon metagenome]|uniref:Spore coat u n=1 Tax=hydrocarbon metagenome TaxID=938273 RepID=A0A0W8FRY9_9ZZZZ
MKRFMVVLAAMALVIAMVGGAFAETTTTVKSTASIANACQLGGIGAIAFGDLDQVTGAAKADVAATGYTLWCTKGYSAAISINNGSNYSGSTRNLKNTTNTDLIPYALAWTTPVEGDGKSTDIATSKVALKGTIADGTYADVSAGAYEDTVTITISY